MFMQLPYCIYILLSEKDHLPYIGFTSDLDKKVEGYNSDGNKSNAPGNENNNTGNIKSKLTAGLHFMPELQGRWEFRLFPTKVIMRF